MKPKDKIIKQLAKEVLEMLRQDIADGNVNDPVLIKMMDQDFEMVGLDGFYVDPIKLN